ncbi:MAG: hypothetical protein N2Z23_07070 [Pyrinomonadaceae bacterium]|nr:hypothetical protein [Pyrinomonadaceae bacterium]MCX7640185.1 hypothetical protein [Pyrinomonadaceae bacterium]MDW8303227.1 hypothetical protein [Acidobacteriota bacterium]
MWNFVKLAVLFSVILFLLLSATAFVYWNKLKTTPQYSLALLVKSSRENNLQKLNELIDVDAVVEDFTLQVVEEAFELYGRNLPPKITENFTASVTSILPLVKDKARIEIAELIREQTKNFEDVPWWAIALAFDRFVEIRIEGDEAQIRRADRDMVLKMRREGNVWKVTSVKDEKLARRVAEKIGREFISFVNKES